MNKNLIISVINVPKHAVIGRVVGRIVHASNMFICKRYGVKAKLFGPITFWPLCAFCHQSLKTLSDFLKIHHQAQAKEAGSHDRYGDKELAPIALSDDQGSKERKAKSAKSAKDQSCQFFFLFRRHFLFCHTALNTTKYIPYLISESGRNVNIFSTIHITKTGDQTCQYG